MLGASLLGALGTWGGYPGVSEGTPGTSKKLKQRYKGSTGTRIGYPQPQPTVDPNALSKPTPTPQPTRTPQPKKLTAEQIALQKQQAAAPYSWDLRANLEDRRKNFHLPKTSLVSRQDVMGKKNANPSTYGPSVYTETSFPTLVQKVGFDKKNSMRNLKRVRGRPDGTLVERQDWTKKIRDFKNRKVGGAIVNSPYQYGKQVG